MSNRFLFGQWPVGVGSGFGMRVAQPGLQVTSSNDADLGFSSDWPAVLPIHDKGSFSFTNNATGTGTYVSALPYTPFGMAAFYPNGGPPTDNSNDFFPGWELSGSGGTAPPGQSGPGIWFYPDRVVATYPVPATAGYPKTGFTVLWVVFKGAMDLSAP